MLLCAAKCLATHFSRCGENAVWVRKGLWLARQTVRYSTGNLGRVTGYAVALTGDTARAGGQVWFSGGKLAGDLSLPRLRARRDGASSGTGPGNQTQSSGSPWPGPRALPALTVLPAVPGRSA